MSQYEELITRYRHCGDDLQKALRGVELNILDRQPGPGKWTIRQILAHLADAEIVGSARLRWIIAQPGSRLIGWNQELWADKTQYHRQDLNSSLAVLTALQRATAEVLERLPADAWSNKATHEERGELSLLEIFRGNVEHAERHAQQIRNILAGSVAVA